MVGHAGLVMCVYKQRRVLLLAPMLHFDFWGMHADPGDDELSLWAWGQGAFNLSLVLVVVFAILLLHLFLF